MSLEGGLNPAWQSALAEDAGTDWAAEREEPLPPSRLLLWLRAHALEVGAWAVVLGVAALLRFAALGDLPLGPDESPVALDAWRLALGRAGRDLDASALLTHGLLVVFALMGASDYAARVLPALAGTALALAPLLLRLPLGPTAAVGTGAILALSPLVVFASRRVDGAILTALAVLLLVGAAARAVETGDRRWALGAAALLALALASGSVAVPALLALAGAAAIAWGGARAAVWTRVRPLVTPAWWPLLVFLATLVLVGTAGLTHLRGLQAALIDPWGTWLAPWQPRELAIPWLAALLLYDLPLVGAAVAGLVLSARRERPFDHFILWWAALGALPLLFQPADPRPFLTLWALPLALLGGQALAALVAWGWTRAGLGRALLLAVLLGLDLAFIVDTGRLIASIAAAPAGFGLQVQGTSLAYTLLILGFLALVHWHLRDWLDRRTVARAAALAGVVLGVTFAITVNGRLQYGESGAGRAELLRPVVLSPDILAVSEELQAWARQDQQQTIPVDAALRPTLLWYLRDVPSVQFFDRPAVQGVQARSVWAAGPNAPAGERRPWRETVTFGPVVSDKLIWNWWLYRQAWLVPTRGDIIVVR